jgi:hypothetical protein
MLAIGNELVVQPSQGKEGDSVLGTVRPERRVEGAVSERRTPEDDAGDGTAVQKLP